LDKTDGGFDAAMVRLEFRITFEQIPSRMPDFRVEEAGLRPSLVPAMVAGYEHVPFVFMPGKKVGGPRIPTDLSEVLHSTSLVGKSIRRPRMGRGTRFSLTIPKRPLGG
jgi:hypothetical protein